MVLAVVSFQVFPGRDVTVIKDGAAYRVSTVFDTEADALLAAEVDLEPGDRVLAGYGGSHASVAVQRARPVVVEVDGEMIEVRTHASTVAGVLAEAGIDLRDGDEVTLDGHSAALRSSLASAAYVARRAAPVTHEVAALSPSTLRVGIVRARPVAVVVDTMQVELSTAATTVAGVLADLGMTVREGDLVRPSLETPVTAGLTIRLAKARSVNLRLDGKDQVLYTQARSVADVLGILGVVPGPDDVVTPAPDTLVTNGMSIVIGLTRMVEEVVEEAVPPATVYES
ncbi:MAG: ubiquitin-like domain-containing protein, partial [Dehalococcoidia bacterium]